MKTRRGISIVDLLAAAGAIAAGYAISRGYWRWLASGEDASIAFEPGNPYSILKYLTWVCLAGAAPATFALTLMRVAGGKGRGSRRKAARSCGGAALVGATSGLLFAAVQCAAIFAVYRTIKTSLPGASDDPFSQIDVEFLVWRLATLAGPLPAAGVVCAWVLGIWQKPKRKSDRLDHAGLATGLLWILLALLFLILQVFILMM